MPPEPGRQARWRNIFDSLLGEILLWLLIILMLAWGIGVVMIYNVTGEFANEPYDEMLADNVQAIAKLVGMDKGRFTINLPQPAWEMLHTDQQDKVYFQVSDAQGNMLVGDPGVPWIAARHDQVTDKVFWRDDELDDVDVRVAYLFKTLSPGQPPVLIQVAETRNKRNGMAARIVSSVIVPQFAIVPLAVLLIYVAVSRGITPLHRLQDELRARRPSDLSAISLERIPVEIKPLIEALNDTMGRLEESLAGQRRFIADAAHQLKTPLAGLRAQIELAVDERSPAALHDCMRQMLQAVERLTNMTQKLLALARAESLHEQAIEFAAVDLAELLPRVAREAATQALPRRITLSFEAPDAVPTVSGSALLLFELFANLLDNAIRYTPDGGHVGIRLKLDKQSPVVDIEDTGQGIPEAQRNLVFDRFYRVLGTKVDGSGLGLSIVKEIADLHHAKVSLGSGENGKGTCVSISFLQSNFTQSTGGAQ